MISVSIINPLIYVVDVGVIIAYIKRWYLKSQGDKCMLTQAEANAAFEGPTLDMANQFANIINLIMSAMFFHSILPLAIPIGCGGLFLQYWANKVIFLLNK
jgi:C4-dicarboxylate transporter